MGNGDRASKYKERTRQKWFEDIAKISIKNLCYN